MNTIAAEKINLHKMLDKIPADRMEAVRSYLDALVGKTPPPASKTNLWGIWQGTEFEKLDTGSLAEDLQELRKEMGTTILSRKLQ